MSDSLSAKYIIDGVAQESTPADLLGAVATSSCAGLEAGDRGDAPVFVDDTPDPAIEFHSWDPSKIQEYVDSATAARPEIPLPFAESASRKKIASALCDSLWLKGHFCLENLVLGLEWKWNDAPVGARASFYSSVKACAEYVDSLGLQINSAGVVDSSEKCDLKVTVSLSENGTTGEDDLSEDNSGLYMRDEESCPSSAVPDPQSWIVYVPFDTSDYRMGGSALARSLGLGGGVAPQVSDADYFMDCFEVVREFVEDGVLLAGATVCEGGLLPALEKFCSSTGALVDISDSLKASGETNPVRLLFAEVPGVLLQIRDIDFDYMDAEFLLQDVAFFPLGHPDASFGGVRIKASAKSDIQKILESLIQNAEGED